MAQGRPIGLDFSESAHERLIAALRAARSGTWRWMIAEDRVEWDEALCAVYGLPPDRAPRTSADFLALVHPEDQAHAWTAIEACLQRGEDADYRFRAVVDDRVRWIHDRSALVRDAEGNPAYLLRACLDVTDAQRMEEERDAALARERLLAAELNHRVKNHLAMIVSMLRLKRAKQTDPHAAEDFAKAINRINTIAYLHEQLHRQGAVSTLRAKDYLEDVCDNLEASLLPDTRIRLAREIEDVGIEVDQAVPLGLIVNEAVTNAVHHAFPRGTEGRIIVRFRVRRSRAMLAVADDGRGFDRSRAFGIGTRMMRALADQMDSRLRIAGRKGVVCALAFPASAGVSG